MVTAKEDMGKWPIPDDLWKADSLNQFSIVVESVTISNLSGWNRQYVMHVVTAIILIAFMPVV